MLRAAASTSSRVPVTEETRRVGGAEEARDGGEAMGEAPLEVAVSGVDGGGDDSGEAGENETTFFLGSERGPTSIGAGRGGGGRDGLIGSGPPQ